MNAIGLHWVAIAIAIVLLVPGNVGRLPPMPVDPPTGPEASTVRLGPEPSLHGGPLGLGAQGRLIVTPSDPSVVPNDGIATNLTGFGYLPLGADSSYQIAVEEVIGNYEAVFGIFDNAPLGPVPFFDVFTNQTEQSVHLAYGTSPIQGGISYEFELTSSGAGVWVLRINGGPIGGPANSSSFDFGTTTATWLGGIGFSEVALYQNQSDVPTIVTTTTVFAFHQPGGWYLPTGATSTFTGQGGRPWGIEGRLQHGTLAPDEIRSGSAIATLANGTPLWSGGPVPVQVALSLSATTAVATTPLLATIVVRSTSGPPIPGVPLLLTSDLRGGVVAPPFVTDPNGSAAVVFLTPNVSTNSNDLVRARVTIPGYIGSTALGVELTPPAQLAVAFSGGSTVVAPNGSVDLEFAATDGSGRPVADLLFQFSSGPGGVLASGQARSGHDGVVRIGFAAGPVPTTVLVLASVIEPGYWGSGSVAVHVRAVAPSLLERAEPWVALAIAIAALAAAVVVVRRRWRHRTQIPDLPLGAEGPRPLARATVEPPADPTEPGLGR